MVQATDVDDFAIMVGGQLLKRAHNSSAKEYHCPTCLNRFEDKWLLADHLRRAHREGANRIFSKQYGEYHCLICALKLESSQLLKKHVFRHHTEYDVRAKYGRSVEEFIGFKYMKRFRE